MKAHRRGTPRLTWFKLAVCICLAAMAASLFTPYPAQIIRALKGEPEQAPPDSGAYPPHESIPAEQPGQEEPAPPLTPSVPGKEPEDSRLATPWTPERTIALPPVQYPPFPPVLPTKPAEGAMTNIYELARGLNLKTQVNFQPGTLASRDRETKSNYQMTLTLNVKQPKALTKKEDILNINPKLGTMLPGLSTLFKHARVSPYYGQIYVRKQTEIRKNLASLLKLLDRHNYYDTETILETTYPDTGRKLLWLQSEMDVVSDGSDGDRLSTMPDNYGQIYVRKQTEIRKNLASLLKLLDRHNYYDTETILETTYPDTGRKLLWLQSEMDVVSDGSDGDRLSTMPDKILKSSFYQPSTSYRWKKRTDKPNPLLKPWQQRLASYKKTLEKASAAEKPALRRKIDHAERVIEELKRYSFLISEYDPFIVVPLGVVNQSSPFSPQFGDYAIVIVGDKLYPALVGDAGPRYKTGEGSLRLSREINPKAGPYSRPVSDLVVSYLIFPGSADLEAGPPDYEKLTAKCQELLHDIGGMGKDFKLHQWEDLLAPKPPPAPPRAQTRERQSCGNTCERPEEGGCPCGQAGGKSGPGSLPCHSARSGTRQNRRVGYRASFQEKRKAFHMRE